MAHSSIWFEFESWFWLKINAQMPRSTEKKAVTVVVVVAVASNIKNVSVISIINFVCLVRALRAICKAKDERKWIRVKDYQLDQDVIASPNNEMFGCTIHHKMDVFTHSMKTYGATKNERLTIRSMSLARRGFSVSCVDGKKKFTHV